MKLYNKELDTHKLTKHIIKDFCIHYKKGIIGAFLFMIVLYVQTTNIELQTASLIDLYQGVYSVDLILIIFILGFIFIINSIFKVYDKNILLIRCLNIHTWCYQKVQTCVYVVFGYLFFVNSPFFSLLLNNLIGNINFEFVVFWIVSILCQGLGFIVIGTLYLFIRNLTGHNVISSILTYLVISIPNTIQGLFYVRLDRFTDYMFLNNMNKDSAIVSIPAIMIAMVVTEVLLLYLNFKTVEKKDIYLG